MADDFEVQAPIAVANFVIDLAEQNDRPVTNLQLQKILYFLQSYSLVNFGKKLLNGTFSKWKYGPVEKEIYRIFKSNGADYIQTPSLNINLDAKGNLQFSEPVIMNEKLLGSEKKFEELKKFTLSLLSIPTWTLVQITHEQDCWKDASEKIKMHIAPDYTDEEMKRDFKKSKLKIDSNLN